ncbi:hypothetical protein EC1_08250 [Faecalitalea cylindroides T2-87]|uniref:Uncharacterized protein n=1 Tax=Faecalitalea cylindroides T2-87 TaxID=717960 RepID=D4JDZ7_9FIRM|nr:hypothetical protein EC1_08250 [Faecalitalea cylindroides T2-87]
MIKLYKKQDDKINVLKHIDQFLTSPDSRTHSTKQILLRYYFKTSNPSRIKKPLKDNTTKALIYI